MEGFGFCCSGQQVSDEAHQAKGEINKRSEASRIQTIQRDLPTRLVFAVSFTAPLSLPVNTDLLCIASL